MGFFTDDLTTAASALLAACEHTGQTLITAESCTGGLISAVLTAVPGSSKVVEGGFVTYSNTAKETMLDVPPSLIRVHGAVSQDVAIAMARGALAESAASLAIAVTGIAGPGGATPDKPVGLVHIAIANGGGRVCHEAPVFKGDRDAVRSQTVLHAMAMATQMVLSGTGS